MNLLDFNVDLEAEKPSSSSSSSTIPYYHLITLCFDRLRTTLRSLELFAALLLFLWISIHLPIALQISGHFFHRFAAVMQSPLFVFLLFNSIIVAVIIKSSGRFAAGQNGEYRHCLMEFDGSVDCSCSEAAEENGEVAFQDKQVIATAVDCIEAEEAGSENDVVLGCESESEVEEDDLSSEEFQRAVEEFIAKNLRLRREETFTVDHGLVNGN
ncbi:hypothetical protein LINPERHAP1_LOCUS27032 [Linum perenne]